MENQKIFKNIELLGGRYCQEYLYNKKLNKQKLEKDWWEALKFFFSRSFMRGRKDELSNEYYCFTIEVLKKAFSIDEKSDESYKILKKHEQYFGRQFVLDFKQRRGIGRGNALSNNYKEDFKKEVVAKNPIVALLIKRQLTKIEWEDGDYPKKVFLGNDEDIMMVLDTLKFISDNGRKNVYSYIKNVITESGVETAYKEVTAIRGVGDKIASLIIRDISLINPEIVKNDYNYYEKAFPVDTWVRQVAQKLNLKLNLKLNPNNATDVEIRNCFINKCLSSKKDPLKFAAGLWYMGFNCLDILINDCLGVVPLRKSQ